MQKLSKPAIEPLEARVFLSAVQVPLTWKTAAPMPVPRAEGGSFVADGRLYTFGGFNDGQLHISTETDYYDPATNKWTRVADAPVRVNDDPVAVDPVTDTAWIGGFYLNDGFHPSPLVYSYNIKTNQWTQGPSLPANIGAGGMGIVGRELHYWGGRDKNNIGTTAHLRLNLDDVAAGWIADTPIPLTTNHVGTAVVGGKLYSIGGIVNKNENHSNEKNVWIYDPATRQWSAGTPMSFGVGHIASAVAVWNDQIIVAGGEVDGDADVMTKAVLDYDTATNTWTRLTDLPDFRQSSFAAAIGDTLVITGGNTYNAPYINGMTWTALLAPPGNTGGTPGGGTTGGGTTGGPPGDGSTGGGTDGGGTTGVPPSGGTTDGGTPPTGGTPSGGTPSGGGTVGTPSPGSGVVADPPPPIPTDPNGPDLTGAIRAHLPHQLIAGDKSHATVIVHNAGPGAAVGNFGITLAMSTDGTATNAITVGALDNRMLRLRPGKNKSFSIRLALPADMLTGNYTLIATIDSSNAFVEAIETNNIATTSPVMVNAQVHNLAATAILSKPTLRPGHDARVQMQLQNTGNVLAAGDAMLTLSAAPVAAAGAAQVQPTEIISILKHLRIHAGHAKKLAIRFHVPAGWSGDYQLFVAISPISLADTDPSDNAASTQISII